MNRIRVWLVALALLCGVANAAPPSLPPDAELMITDARGVIVGVGTLVDGTAFDLALLTGFEGFGVLTVFLSDGATWTVEVVVLDGTVRVEGVDLLELLPTTIEHVAVRFEPASGARRAPAGPGATGGGPPVDSPGVGPPSEPPRGPPDDVPRGPPADGPGRGPANRP